MRFDAISSRDQIYQMSLRNFVRGKNFGHQKLHYQISKKQWEEALGTGIMHHLICHPECKSLNYLSQCAFILFGLLPYKTSLSLAYRVWWGPPHQVARDPQLRHQPPNFVPVLIKCIPMVDGCWIVIMSIHKWIMSSTMNALDKDVLS